MQRHISVLLLYDWCRLIFASLRMYLPLSAHLLLSRIHIQKQQHSSSNNYHWIFSYAVEQSCGCIRWLWNSRAEGPAAEDHIPFPHWRRMMLFNMGWSWCTWLLKGVGDTQISLIYIRPKTHSWLNQSLNSISLSCVLHFVPRLLGQALQALVL